jgi:hypothetical protein
MRFQVQESDFPKGEQRVAEQVAHLHKQLSRFSMIPVTAQTKTRNEIRGLAIRLSRVTGDVPTEIMQRYNFPWTTTNNNTSCKVPDENPRVAKNENVSHSEPRSNRQIKRPILSADNAPQEPSLQVAPLRYVPPQNKSQLHQVPGSKESVPYSGVAGENYGNGEWNTSELVSWIVGEPLKAKRYMPAKPTITNFEVNHFSLKIPLAHKKTALNRNRLQGLRSALVPKDKFVRQLEG